MTEERIEADPMPGDRYVHFKGGRYTVVARARDAETTAEAVVYQGDSGTWVRALSRWIEPVVWPDGVTRARFVPEKDAGGVAPGMTTKKLPWEYCECGCKCHDLTIAGLTFSVFNDLKGGYWYYEGHNARSFSKAKFSSMEEIDKVVAAWKYVWGAGVDPTWPEAWQRALKGMRSTEARLVCADLLRTKKFRSTFRQSLRDQLVTWLDGDRKYASPFSERQWQCLMTTHSAHEARCIDSALYSSRTYNGAPVPVTKKKVA